MTGMSNPLGTYPDEDVKLTLYRHGLSLAVLFELLAEHGIITTEETQRVAQRLHRELVGLDTDHP